MSEIIRDRVIKVIKEYSKINDIHTVLQPNDDLVALGINSLIFIRIVVLIEKEFGIEFEDTKLDYTSFTSLNTLCEYISELQKKSENNIEGDYHSIEGEY